MAPEETTVPAWMRPPVSRWSDPPGPPDRALRSRRVLVAAAAREIDRHGYHAASVRDILAGTGLTKGALYFHFGSKHRLASALVDEVVASWREIADEIAGRGLDPLWRLLVETDAYVARWMYDPLVRGASRAMYESEDFAEDCDRWMRTWQRSTEERFEQAARAGLLRPGVEPGPAARLVQAARTGHHTLAERVPGDPDLADRMTDTWQSLLPFIAIPDWLLGWRAGPWARRPAPCPSPYIRAAEPGDEHEPRSEPEAPRAHLTAVGM